MKLALVGAGQRGMIYARYAYEHGIEIAAIAEPDRLRRQVAQNTFMLRDEQCFHDGEELLAHPQLADALIIATMDRQHYPHAMAALERGYHLLLEKPISPEAEECVRLAARAKALNRTVIICHVLRYAPFFRELKRIIDENTLGPIVSIQHNENIGNYHMAHSFVRGNWRRSDETSPIIMQKSCHDMDLLYWLTGSRCAQISSFGSLSYFNAAHAPQGAAERCTQCRYQDTCRYSAYRCYLPVAGSWPAASLSTDQSEAGLRKALEEGLYGRCVYHCDNTVCDHQTTNMLLENGVTATFNLSAFTNRIERTMKIMCENGEIRAAEGLNRIELIPFTENSVNRVQTSVIAPSSSDSGHGGGDAGLMRDFIKMLNGERTPYTTSIQDSLESHMMACAAEISRLEARTVSLAELRRE